VTAVLRNRISACSALRKLRTTFDACCLLIFAAGPAGAEFRPLDRLEDNSGAPHKVGAHVSGMRAEP
jgi:hypothetical protein